MHKEIYLLGGGILAELIIETISLIPEFTVLGIFDDTFKIGDRVCDIPVLGAIRDSKKEKYQNLCIAIGEPKHRKILSEKPIFKNKNFPSIIHPTALISNFSRIDQGVFIGPFCSVLNGSRIKKFSCLLAYCNINQNIIIDDFVLIGASSTIGNNAKINTGAHLALSSVINPAEQIEAWSYIQK